MHELAYKVFLEKVLASFKVLRLRDHGPPGCLLRHDVDASLAHAIKMAELEYDLGVKSSYYVLHTAGYYKKPDLIERCRYLQDMGHEVGLHNNVIVTALRNPYSTVEGVLENELNFLRDGGIDVRGTTSHGDPLCNEFGFINYQIFTSCVPHRRPDHVSDIKFYTVEMSDYGLEYEGVHIKRNCYLSDSGSIWWWDIPGEVEAPPKETQDVMGYLDAVGRVEGIVLHALVHPIWWKL